MEASSLPSPLAVLNWLEANLKESDTDQYERGEDRAAQKPRHSC